MFFKTFLVIASLAVLGAACAQGPRLPYAPATTGADVVGHADYRFPPGAPRGRVSVAALGTTQTGDGAWFTHVRITVTNDDDPAPWRLDKTEQRLEITTGRARDTHELLPPRAAPDDSPLSVEVAPGETKVVELFFPLASAARSQAERSFTALWTVHVGQLNVPMATPFELLVTAMPPVP